MQFIGANGAHIPIVGLGTWQLTGKTCMRIVSEALRLGYRHIDTAAMYGNEVEVGEAVRASDVKRESVFLTTKVWLDDLRAKSLRRSVEQSLRRLKLPYVDLVLIHWPNPSIPLRETLPAMAEAKRDGLTRHIGVSNFNVALVEEAVRLSEEPLVTNQIELHPFVNASMVIAVCRRYGLSITAYCPIARGNAAADLVLARIGKLYGKSAAQVSLRYLVQQGMIVIPRTSKPERLKENLALFDFELSGEDMAEIGKLAHRSGRVINWSASPAWD